MIYSGVDNLRFAQTIKPIGVLVAVQDWLARLTAREAY